MIVATPGHGAEVGAEALEQRSLRDQFVEDDDEEIPLDCRARAGGQHRSGTMERHDVCLGHVHERSISEHAFDRQSSLSVEFEVHVSSDTSRRARGVGDVRSAIEMGELRRNSHEIRRGRIERCRCATERLVALDVSCASELGDLR